MVPGKTAEVPAMYRTDRQGAQALQTACVISEVGVVGVFDQRPIVDDVAAERGRGGRFVQADAARGVAGGVQHLQDPITQVQYVAFVDRGGGRCSLDPILGVAQWAVGVRFEHVIADKGFAQVVFAVWRGEDVRFGRVYQALGE